MICHRSPSRTRRGVTFIETVLASALLALTVSTVLSVFGSATKAQARSQRFLGAAEIANRLILMHLDDPDSMPTRNGTIPYPPHASKPIEYRWELEATPIDVEDFSPQAVRRNRATSSSISFEDRLENVRVRVWVSEKSGGSYEPVQGVPSVELVRLVDKFNFGRNPDSLRAMISTEEGRARIFRLLVAPGSGGQPPAPNGGAGNGSGGRP